MTHRSKKTFFLHFFQKKFAKALMFAVTLLRISGRGDGREEILSGHSRIHVGSLSGFDVGYFLTEKTQ